MSADWPMVCLGNYCEKIGSGATPKGGKSVYLDVGETALIRSQNVYNEGFTASGLAFISEEAADKLRNVSIEPNDILLNITGDSVARVCMAPEEYLPARVNQHVAIIRPDNSRLDSRFVRYFLSSPEQQRLLLTIASSGATRNALTKSHIEQLEVPMPGLEIQQAIANQLETLDKKIKLNQQINRTLEQMAQAIFKSWFVDFEPAKAKTAALEAGGSEEDALVAAMQAISGKDQTQLARFKTEQPEQYNELRTTAELFPAAMQDSELGEIPKGWKHGTFEDLCLKVESGGTPRRNEPAYWGKGIKWLSSGEVRDVVVYSTNESITYSGLKGSSAKLWPKYTTVVAMYGATAGQVCLLADEMASNQACCGLVPMEMCRAYIFILARNSIASLAGKASGSAQQNLNKSLVANHKVLLPEDKVLARFELKVRVLLDAWILNSHECTKLANLRDTLLPKLLSGELSIDKVEQAMEVAQ